MQQVGALATMSTGDHASRVMLIEPLRETGSSVVQSDSRIGP
jgi:hypothetical protein